MRISYLFLLFLLLPLCFDGDAAFRRQLGVQLGSELVELATQGGQRSAHLARDPAALLLLALVDGRLSQPVGSVPAVCAQYATALGN